MDSGTPTPGNALSRLPNGPLVEICSYLSDCDKQSLRSTGRTVASRLHNTGIWTSQQAQSHLEHHTLLIEARWRHFIARHQPLLARAQALYHTYREELGDEPGDTDDPWKFYHAKLTSTFISRDLSLDAKIRAMSEIILQIEDLERARQRQNSGISALTATAAGLTLGGIYLWIKNRE